MFIDELIKNYYSEVGPNYKNSFTPGQLVWIYFLYNYENLEVWRPYACDETRTTVKLFRIQASPPDMFKRSYPLYFPPLEINEEFVVIRAKVRPAIILTLPPKEIKIQKLRRGRKINSNHCLLAPLFSVEDKYGEPKFPPGFIDRVRELEYPNLFFLPSNYEYCIRDSLVRFERIFSCYINHLDPINLKIDDYAYNLFFDQLESFLFNRDVGWYEYLREELRKEKLKTSS